MVTIREIFVQIIQVMSLKSQGSYDCGSAFSIKKQDQAAVLSVGIWEYVDDVLLFMELRFLTRRELPAKYCANLENNYLYAPHQYF